MRRPDSTLAQKLEAGQFVRLVQIDPPKGTNAEQGLKLLDESGLNLTTATSLRDAAKKIVEMVKQ